MKTERLTADVAAKTWAGGVGPAASTNHEGFSEDTLPCHRRDSKPDDAGSGVTAPRPVTVAPHTSPLLEVTPQNEYCQELLGWLEMAHTALREQQRVVRQEDQEEPLLFSPRDMVWLENRRRRKGENPNYRLSFRVPTPY